MGEAELVSALIGGIYDAALDPGLWPSVLREIARFVGGPAAALYAKDVTGKHGNLYYDDGGIEPRYVQLYFEKYVRLDPTTTTHYFAEVGDAVATDDILPYEEFLKTRFYLEWARPQGLVDHVTSVLDKTTTSVALFGVFRHKRDGRADEETYRRVRLIAPHVRRAVLIGRTIELKTAEAAHLADALDEISAGMFLAEASGRIVHANAAAHAMLAGGGFLSAPGGRLAATDAESDAALRDALAAAGSGDAAVGVKGIALPLVAAGGERYVAHVLPLTSGKRRKVAISYAAAAVVFVHRAALATPSPPEIIARAYGLTPTELRVLLGVVEVGGTPMVAEALGIGETTVKFHLRRLFEKTGTHRQADLVKLVAGFSHGLRG